MRWGSGAASVDPVGGKRLPPEFSEAEFFKIATPGTEVPEVWIAATPEGAGEDKTGANVTGLPVTTLGPEAPSFGVFVRSGFKGVLLDALVAPGASASSAEAGTLHKRFDPMRFKIVASDVAGRPAGDSGLLGGIKLPSAASN